MVITSRLLYSRALVCSLLYQGTVISMHENPFSVRPANPNLNPAEERKKHDALEYGRQTLLKTFRQLSKSNEKKKLDNPFMTLGIRSAPLTAEDSLSNAPCLLFYYLFDDWYSSYSLVVQAKHQYTAKLEKLVSSAMACVSLSQLMAL